PHPTLVVLTTPGDRPHNWIRAGQALERVLLTATAHRLAATPLNQALEVPELRRLVTDLHTAGHAQAILRIGYGEAVPATPRRAPSDVTEDVTENVSG
ncbi:MAG TPA: nitroreductase, partial [Micromonosporaceae bacterium]|nr:nitroreductase [Micromonosporaceae bacterium]